MIQLSILIVIVALALILIAIFVIPGIKSWKIIATVVVTAIILEIGLLAWIQKAASTLPPGAQLIDRKDVSDKE